jgi:hypothetical protein
LSGLSSNNDNQDTDACTECESASSTHINTGNLTIDHGLVSYRSFGQDRSLRFVYHSTRTDPQPINTNDATIPLRSAVPNTVSTKLTVGGIEQGQELFTQTGGILSESVDETIRQAVQFDAAELATGLYPYNLMITNNFNISSVGTSASDTVLVNNEVASDFGAGWTLDGLARLHVQPSTVILTEGDGTTKRFDGGLGFGPPSFYGNLTGPLALAVAVDDLNNDGRVDVVVPDHSTNAAYVFLGDGLGGIPTINTVPSGAGPVATAVGDFDGDGRQDIAVANRNANTITVHWDLGDGTFEASPVSLAAEVETVGAVNMSNPPDGKDELVATTEYGSPFRWVFVYAEDGARGFTWNNYDSAAGPIGLALDDFNGDGLPDVAAGATLSNVVSVFLNDGAGGLLPKIDYGAGSMTSFWGVWTIAAADFDNDTFPDIAAVGGGAVVILLGDGTGGLLFADRSGLRWQCRSSRPGNRHRSSTQSAPQRAWFYRPSSVPPLRFVGSANPNHNQDRRWPPGLVNQFA